MITVSIFVFIRQSSDYIYVPLPGRSGQLPWVWPGCSLALREFPVRFAPPSRALLRQELAAEGWHLFISKMSSHTVHHEQHRHPGAVHKQHVRRVLCRRRENRASDPRGFSCLSRRRCTRTSASWRRIEGRHAEPRREQAEIVGIIAQLSVGHFFAAEPLGRLILGGQFDASVPVIRILSLLPFVLQSEQHLRGADHDQLRTEGTPAAKILAIAGVVNVVRGTILVHPTITSASASPLLTEGFPSRSRHTSLCDRTGWTFSGGTGTRSRIMVYDCLIVGAGWAGCVTTELANGLGRGLARRARDHIGNAYDYRPGIVSSAVRASHLPPAKEVWDYVDPVHGLERVRSSRPGELQIGWSIFRSSRYAGTTMQPAVHGRAGPRRSMPSTRVPTERIACGTSWSPRLGGSCTSCSMSTTKLWGLYPHELAAQVTRRVPSGRRGHGTS